MLGQREFNSQHARDGYVTVLALIAINVLAYITIGGGSELYKELALSSEGIRSGRVYELATSMFLHGNFSHILFNMWGLYLFGRMVAPILGRTKFLLLYFISGIVGNLLWLAFSWEQPFYVVGASGALYGVMMAAAMLVPQMRLMLLFFPQPIRITTLIIVYTALELFSQFSGGSGIAHLAHLGGFLGGYIYIRLAVKSMVGWDPLQKVFKGGVSAKPKFHKMPKYNPKNQSGPVPKSEMERLQDKLANGGINSLTPEEVETLRRIRQQMQDSSRKH